jgi:succinate semialdehyde reductase (NADPH)
MRAAVLFKYNYPLEVRDVNLSPPKEGEIKVKVVSAGVCGSELKAISGDYGIPLPFIPGHEVAGIVEEVGPNVTKLKPKDKVVISFIFPCGKCRMCIEGKENYCETALKYRNKGVLLDGTSRLSINGERAFHYLASGFSEYCVVPETAATKVEFDYDLKFLAPLGCAGLTAYGAVASSEIKPGESVAVLGAGGVGLSIVQLLKSSGAGEIIVIDVEDWKLEKALEIGATVIINANKENVTEAINKIGGVDVAIEAVGLPQTISEAIKIVKTNGRAIVVGITHTNVTVPINFIEVVRKGIRIIGNRGGRPRVDMPKLLELVRLGKFSTLKLISNTYKLDEVNEAIKSLKEGKSIRSLVLI